MHEHHPFDVETEQPDNRNLFVFGVAIAFIFFTCGIVLTSLFHRASSALVEQRSTAASYELRELRAQEDERLTTYGWVDKEKQLVRIPIDLAMKLTVEGAKQ